MTGQRFHLGLRTLQNTSRTLESNAKFLHVLTSALSMATLHWIPAAVVFSVAKITDHDAAAETNWARVTTDDMTESLMTQTSRARHRRRRRRTALYTGRQFIRFLSASAPASLSVVRTIHVVPPDNQIAQV